MVRLWAKYHIIFKEELIILPGLLLTISFLSTPLKFETSFSLKKKA